MAPRRIVSPNNRDWGQTRQISDADVPKLTDRGRAILVQLLAAIERNGIVLMTSRAELRTSGEFMQQLYYDGWVNGAGSNDTRGTGNTAASSWWWLTTSGEATVRTIAGPTGMETKANV